MCDRTASLADLSQRFGADAAGFVNVLENICGRNPSDPPAGDTTSCSWSVRGGQEIVRLGVHMHLLGRGMKIVLDPGTPQAQTLLNVTNYDFNYQRSYTLKTPVLTHRGDTIGVTCTYDPTLRQELPQLRKLPLRDLGRRIVRRDVPRAGADGVRHRSGLVLDPRALDPLIRPDLAVRARRSPGLADITRTDPPS
jgi:hypothetical protein